MKRRDFLKSSSALSLIAGFPLLPKNSSTKKLRLRWRIALVVPKTLPIWGPGIERFASNVEKLTDGQLKIRVYGAGELVPALGTFDAVSSGEVQMGHSAAYYWQGKIPAAPFFTTIPFGMHANGMYAWLESGGQALWDELMQPFNVFCLPCGNPGIQTIGWYRKEIKSLADLKGLKVRIPGLAGKVFEKSGATPVLLPGGELFTSLATGILDAVEWIGPYHDYIMGFHKAAPYYYGTGWHEPGAILELMINKKAWDDLPANIQLAIRIAAAEVDRWMQAQWEAKNAEYLAKIKAEGKIKLLQFPSDVLEEFRKSAKILIDEISATSPLAKRIADSYNNFQTLFDDYQNWTSQGL